LSYADHSENYFSVSFNSSCILQQTMLLLDSKNQNVSITTTVQEDFEEALAVRLPHAALSASLVKVIFTRSHWQTFVSLARICLFITADILTSITHR
jgi:hypothetical protein